MFAPSMRERPHCDSVGLGIFGTVLIEQIEDMSRVEGLFKHDTATRVQRTLAVL